MFRGTIWWKKCTSKNCFFVKTLANLFLNFGQKFPRSWQNCFYAFRQTFWWKTNSSKYSASFFWVCLRPLRTFCIFLKVVEIAFQSVQTNDLMKTNFFEKLFFNFFHTKTGTFSDFRQKIYRKVVRTDSYVFMKHFDETYFFQTFFVFGTYSDFEQTFFDIWHKIFHKIVKTALYGFKRTFRRKKWILKIVFIFKIWAKI